MRGQGRLLKNDFLTVLLAFLLPGTLLVLRATRTAMCFAWSCYTPMTPMDILSNSPTTTGRMWEACLRARLS